MQEDILIALRSAANWLDEKRDYRQTAYTMDRAAGEIEHLRRALSDCLETMENNPDGLNGAQVGLFIGRLRAELAANK